MTVEKSELIALQKYVNSQITRISASSNPDTSRLFDLNIVDSNLSLLLFGVEDDESVELGSSDKNVKSALKEFRESRLTSTSADSITEDISDFAGDLISLVDGKLSEAKDWDNEFLSKNVSSRLIYVKEILEELASVSASSKRVKKMWSSSLVPSCIESFSEKNAAAVLGAIKSEKKAASSRENGKKGGRPKKAVAADVAAAVPEKKSSSKSAGAKTSGPKKSASKTKKP